MVIWPGSGGFFYAGQTEMQHFSVDLIMDVVAFLGGGEPKSHAFFGGVD